MSIGLILYSWYGNVFVETSSQPYISHRALCVSSVLAFPVYFNSPCANTNTFAFRISGMLGLWQEKITVLPLFFNTSK